MNEFKFKRPEEGAEPTNLREWGFEDDYRAINRAVRKFIEKRLDVIFSKDGIGLRVFMRFESQSKGPEILFDVEVEEYSAVCRSAVLLEDLIKDEVFGQKEYAAIMAKRLREIAERLEQDGG